jgi:hypothetical protein
MIIFKDKKYKEKNRNEMKQNNNVKINMYNNFN